MMPDLPILLQSFEFNVYRFVSVMKIRRTHNKRKEFYVEEKKYGLVFCTFIDSYHMRS